MQIQFRANAETPRAAFQTQAGKAALQAAPTTGALGADTFQPSRPSLVVINPAAAPVPAPTGSDAMWSVLGAIGSMLWNGLAAISPAVAMVKTAADAVGAAAQQLLDQIRPQTQPQAQPAKPAVDPGAQARYEAAYKAASEASSEARLRKMHLEVWGNPELWNASASAWWRGQLKTVGGDWDALKAKMVAYREDYEATMKQYQD